MELNVSEVFLETYVPKALTVFEALIETYVPRSVVVHEVSMDAVSLALQIKKGDAMKSLTLKHRRGNEWL